MSYIWLLCQTAAGPEPAGRVVLAPSSVTEAAGVGPGDCLPGPCRGRGLSRPSPQQARRGRLRETWSAGPTPPWHGLSSAQGLGSLHSDPAASVGGARAAAHGTGRSYPGSACLCSGFDQEGNLQTWCWAPGRWPQDASTREGEDQGLGPYFPSEAQPPPPGPCGHTNMPSTRVSINVGPQGLREPLLLLGFPRCLWCSDAAPAGVTGRPCCAGRPSSPAWPSWAA